MSGRLVYVIGPSGAGKDRVLDHAREHLPLDAPVIFAKRFITRQIQKDGEQHTPVSPSGFERILSHGGFALHWTAHGLRYGIGQEIRGWMGLGFHVVVNGSREYLPLALRNFPEALIVHVTASPAVIRDRLIRRARENADDIEDRIQRAVILTEPAAPEVLTIRNDGLLADAGEALLKALMALCVPESVTDDPGLKSAASAQR